MLSAGITSTLLVQILGAFRCGTCLLVIGVQNPIHSILLLIRVFFIGTLLLFTLQREYFAILFLVVYVGAIVVLFLFIIRRLEIKRVNVSRRFRDLFAYRHLIVGLVLVEVLLLLTQDFFDLGAFFALDPSFFTSDAHSRSATLTEGNFYLD
jgi:NADH-quinone oxidoreductase subunit J